MSFLRGPRYTTTWAPGPSSSGGFFVVLTGFAAIVPEEGTYMDALKCATVFNGGLTRTRIRSVSSDYWQFPSVYVQSHN